MYRCWSLVYTVQKQIGMVYQALGQDACMNALLNLVNLEPHSYLCQYITDADSNPQATWTRQAIPYISSYLPTDTRELLSDVVPEIAVWPLDAQFKIVSLHWHPYTTIFLRLG